MLTKTSKEKTQQQDGTKSSSTNKKASRKWHVIGSGAGKGMSVPQYFIKKPCKFMEQFYTVGLGYVDSLPYHDPAWSVDDQAIDITNALNSLQCPPRYKGKKIVSIVAGFDLESGRFIEIVTDRKRKWELLNSDGTVVSVPIGYLFDLIVFLYAQEANEAKLSHAVNYVLSEITGQNVEKWNRAQCEWFFNTKSHFDAYACADDDRSAGDDVDCVDDLDDNDDLDDLDE